MGSTLWLIAILLTATIVSIEGMVRLGEIQKESQFLESSRLEFV